MRSSESNFVITKKRRNIWIERKKQWENALTLNSFENPTSAIVSWILYHPPASVQLKLERIFFFFQRNFLRKAFENVFLNKRIIEFFKIVTCRTLNSQEIVMQLKQKKKYFFKISVCKYSIINSLKTTKGEWNRRNHNQVHV